MSDFHVIRLPAKDYAVLSRRAELAGGSPTQLLTQAIRAPKSYMLICDMDEERLKQAAREVESERKVASQAPTPAVPTKKEIRARADKRIKALRALNDTIQGIYLTDDEGNTPNYTQVQHLKNLRLMPPATCPDWVELRETYLSENMPPEVYVELVRDISRRNGAEMRLLREDPEKVLDIPEGAPLPFLK